MVSTPSAVRRPLLGRTPVALALVIGLAIGLPAPASAQLPELPHLRSNWGSGFFSTGGVRLRDPAGERGIKAGDFVIWPSLMLEGRYDSNLFQEDDSETPQAIGVFRVIPGLALTNPTANKVAFTLGLEGDVRVYMTTDEDIEELNNVGGRADLALDILPKGPVTISIVDQFSRSLQTRTIETSDTFNRNQNRAGARVAIHPGGGALNIVLGYIFDFTFFDDFEDGNYMAHEMMLLTTWRFYPKTAALLEATGTFRNWDSDPQFSGLYVDNKAFRVQAGLTGYITKKLSTVFKVGYGNSFHDEGESFNNVIGLAELSYKFTPGILLSVGFLREFSPSFYANYFVENRTYLKSQFRFWNRLSIELQFGYHLVDYSEFDPAAADQSGAAGLFVSHKERRDQHISTGIKLGVDITRWIGVSLGYDVRAVFTNFRTEQRGVTDSGNFSHVDPGSYVRHQVFGSINVRY